MATDWFHFLLSNKVITFAGKSYFLGRKLSKLKRYLDTLGSLQNRDYWWSGDHLRWCVVENLSHQNIKRSIHVRSLKLVWFCSLLPFLKKRNQNTPSSKLLEATVFMFSDTWHFMFLWHWTVHLLCSLTKVLMHRLVICSWSSYIPAVLVESYKVFHSLCRGAFFVWRALILSWPRIMCSQVRMLKFLEPSREMP